MIGIAWRENRRDVGLRTLVMALLLPVSGGLMITVPVAGQESALSSVKHLRVDTDTIYSLAVDPLDYPDQSYVYLLDDGAVKIEADGRGRETYHQVIQILTQEAVELFGEWSLPWVEGSESIKLNWVRVVTPGGEVISDGPLHQQESTLPTSQLVPVYTDLKMLSVSVAGLAPGVLLDFSHTRTTLYPAMPGAFSSGWSVTTEAPVLRSRLVLDVPVALRMHIRELNLDFEREQHDRDGRTTYVWATSDVEAFDPELFATWPDDGQMGVFYSSAIDWDEIGSWYTELTRGRYEVSPDLEAKLGEIVAGARTLKDSVRAVHRWVTQEIRYVSLSLGMGAYQPRRPEEVFESKAGDCKDKAALFIGLVQKLGVDAYPVLVNQLAMADSLVPSLSEFDHMIVAVEGAEGYTYTDLTADLVTYGAVPFTLQGGFALLLRPGGRTEQVRIPQVPPQNNRVVYSIVGELSEEGAFTGNYRQTGMGAFEEMLRSMMTEATQLSGRQRNQVARAIAGEVFPGASGDSLRMFDPHDFGVEAQLALSISAPKVLSRLGDSYILTLPLPLMSDPAVAQELEQQLPRRYPIDVEEATGPLETSWIFELSLPEGWQADLPTGMEVASRFGTYSAQYSQEGSNLRVVRKILGLRGKEPAESAEELIAWIRAVAEDDVQYIALSRPARNT